jgi:hypothetical protein
MANLISILQWRYWLRTEVSVRWPQGWSHPDHLGNQAESSDPNSHYRWWLESYVGRQGWSWDWRIGPTQNDNRDVVIIKFRRPQDATMFAISFM